jgi:hypothetical protein
LDSSDDSIFFAPSNGLSSRSSTDSFNIDNIASLDSYPSLLLPSRSLSSLPLCDIEHTKAPPCPSTTPRRKGTQHTFLSLMATLALPKGNRPIKKYPNVLVSSPTPQRLRNVPQLKPALRTWIVSIDSPLGQIVDQLCSLASPDQILLIWHLGLLLMEGLTMSGSLRVPAFLRRILSVISERVMVPSPHTCHLLKMNLV